MIRNEKEHEKKQPMQKLAPLQTGLTFIVCYICKTPHINPQSSAGSAKYGIPLGFASKDKSSDIPRELKSTCPGSVNTKLVVNETYSPKRWFHCDESRGIIRKKITQENHILMSNLDEGPNPQDQRHLHPNGRVCLLTGINGSPPKKRSSHGSYGLYGGLIVPSKSRHNFRQVKQELKLHHFLLPFPCMYP